MTEPPEKRRHHYVPVFYLKHFTGPGGVLQLLSRTSGKWFESRPERVGFENDLYRLDTPEEGERADAIEDEFADFEDEASGIIQQIVETRRLPTDEDQLGILLNFIALQEARVPTTKRILTGPRESMAKIIIDMLASSPKLWESTARGAGIDTSRTTHEDIKEFAKSGFTIRVPTEAYIRDAMHRIDTILPFLGRRHWSVFWTDRQGELFVTSDDPVALSWSDGRVGGHPGHGHPNTEVSIPLSSNVALVGSYKRQGTIAEARRETVAAINTRTMSCGAARFAAASERPFIAYDRSGIVNSDIIAAHFARNPSRTD